MRAGNIRWVLRMVRIVKQRNTEIIPKMLAQNVLSSRKVPPYVDR